jgi:hypothetical protein
MLHLSRLRGVGLLHFDFPKLEEGRQAGACDGCGPRSPQLGEPAKPGVPLETTILNSDLVEQR